MKKINNTGCGDWHHGWGYGYTKLGKLSIEMVEDCPINFLWKGRSQGRHGNVHWKNGLVRFMIVSEDHIAVTYMRQSYPMDSEVIKAMNILLTANGSPMRISSEARFELRLPTEV